jgi:hypothetical protein
LKRFKEDGVIFERKEERRKRVTDTKSKIEYNTTSVNSLNNFETNGEVQNYQKMYLVNDQVQVVPYFFMPFTYLPIQNSALL